MEKLKVGTNLFGKKIEIVYEDNILYTNSPKFFNRFYLSNEIPECGVYLVRNTISTLGNAEKSIPKQVDDIYVPTTTAKEAVNTYQTALKVIAVEEINRLKTNKQILNKIKQDIIDPSISNVVPFALIGLFSARSVGQVLGLATLCLLSNIDVYEAIQMIKSFAVSDHCKKILEQNVWLAGLGDLIYEPVKKDDLKLYMKLKNNDLKFK